ncbi:MAG: glutaredoxin family protein [Gammaproteobacteria bacterium]|nr:glutaredoxin family protein [Gammaproteobacteria bacterium]
MSQRRLQLLGTSGCHLCELALTLVVECLDPVFNHVEHIDIADSDELMLRYGIKIPVLRNVENQQELCWPFDSAALKAF